MKSDQLLFPPFRLDIANECLWQGTQQVSLRRKTFAVLRYLVEHANRLVTKEELLAAVWPGIYVSEKGPRICIREIRQALGEDLAAPQFIETVQGRGYRFIALVTTSPRGGHRKSVDCPRAVCRTLRRWTQQPYSTLSAERIKQPRNEQRQPLRSVLNKGLRSSRRGGLSCEIWPWRSGGRKKRS